MRVSLLQAANAGGRFPGAGAFLNRYGSLTWEMARREVADRYSGHMLGVVWAVAHPLVLIGIYVFVFAFVFQAKVGTDRAVAGDYAVYLLAGLIPWLTFQDALNKNVVIIPGNSSLVKQVVFPLEVLPAKSVAASFATQLISTGLFLIYYLIATRSAPWILALLPIVWLIQLLGMLGLSFLLAAVGTYLRDLKEMVGVFGLINLYLMPVFYQPEWVPAFARPFLYLNPFSYMVWVYQDVWFYGRLAHPSAWVVFIAESLGAFWFGLWAFRRLKVYFGNVL